MKYLYFKKSLYYLAKKKEKNKFHNLAKKQLIKAPISLPTASQYLHYLTKAQAIILHRNQISTVRSPRIQRTLFKDGEYDR